MSTLLTAELGVGPAAVVSANVPDMNSFNNRAGHCIPLWRDSAGQEPNVSSAALSTIRGILGFEVSAEDLFCYAYAVLGVPAYVDRFSEELAVPGPRLPITRNADLFLETANVGRALINLHTYGERFVPAGGKRGCVQQGRARLLSAIPDAPEDYPEDFHFDPEAQKLRVGAGLITGVAAQVFEFSVSGLEVVKSWLSNRMMAGAGRKSSALDEVRPEQWTVAMSQELLQLLWLLEHTLATYPAMESLLDRIVAGPLLAASELPQPDEAQCKPPGRNEEEEDMPVQAGLAGL